MKTVYTIGWSSKKHTGVLPLKFEKRERADQLASIISRLFRIGAWSFINNTYTEAEIAEIKQAYQELLKHPLDSGDAKVWHWKE